METLKLLRKNKIKITSEREEIIKFLEKVKQPKSPTEIFSEIKIKLPNVNITTIYRNLELLENLNLVKKVNFGGDYFSYELNVDRPHHHHIVCRNCGKVEDLENISEKFISQLAEQISFKVEDHNLEFFGLCPNCQKEEQDE